MSEIRMCDQCGDIFSLMETGWEEYLKKVQRPDSNGNTHDTMHICPKHQMAKADKLRPRLAIERAFVIEQEDDEDE